MTNSPGIIKDILILTWNFNIKLQNFDYIEKQLVSMVLFIILYLNNFVSNYRGFIKRLLKLELMPDVIMVRKA